MNGFLNLYKPKGVSSAYVLNAVKKSIRKEVVGHMGTLDPLASGVLPVAVGKSTRLFDYLLDKDKIYVATFEFGYRTDTLDLEGKVEERSDVLPTFEQLEEYLQTGKIAELANNNNNSQTRNPAADRRPASNAGDAVVTRRAQARTRSTNDGQPRTDAF